MISFTPRRLSLERSNSCLRGLRDALTERHRRFSVYKVLETPGLRVSRRGKSLVGENNVKRTDNVYRVLQAGRQESLRALLAGLSASLSWGRLGRQGGAGQGQTGREFLGLSAPAEVCNSVFFFLSIFEEPRFG